MAIGFESKEENNQSSEDPGKLILNWLESLQKSLDFIYTEQTQKLSVTEALSGNPKIKVCDPYYSTTEPPLKGKIHQVDGEKPSRVEKLSGFATLTLATGDEITATWRGGKREGFGKLFGPRLEKNGINHLSGYYQDGILEGRGKLHMLDNTVREVWFQHGYAHGPARGSTLDGKLDYIGWYKAGIPCGYSWKSVRGDGWLVGQVDSEGQFTGNEIVFVYPDLRTGLVGEFNQGELVGASPAEVVGASFAANVLVPTFRTTSDKIYKRWISTTEDIVCPLHLADPYESTVVEVKTSDVKGAGEGLFAKVDIGANVIIAYYNGIRPNPGERIKEEETGYAIFLEYNNRMRKDAKHLDIPRKYQRSEDYSASLAHKLNHRFDPNCVWANAEHPVFGLVPAVRTLVDVKAGDELTIHYNMDMENAVDWYVEEWDKHSRKC